MSEPTPARVPGRKPDIADKRWAQLGQDLRLHQVPNLRATAEQWRNGLTALTALVTLATVVKGKDTVDQLTTTGRIATATFAGVALACLLYGSWRAMRAAFGVPGDTVLLSGAELERWSREQVREGVTDLTHARWSFLAGVVLLALAVGITWFNAPADTPPHVRITVAGQGHCGILVSSTGGQMILEEQGAQPGEETVFRLRDVGAVAVVPSCT